MPKTLLIVFLLFGVPFIMLITQQSPFILIVIAVAVAVALLAKRQVRTSRLNRDLALVDRDAESRNRLIDARMARQKGNQIPTD